MLCDIGVTLLLYSDDYFIFTRNKMNAITDDEVSSELPVANMNESKVTNINWGKSLEYMPVVTIKEIEMHRNESGKDKGGAILKTLERGRRFKEERYISADSIYTALHGDLIFVKASCKASMKKEVRNVNITLHKNDSYVKGASCSCPAGLSGYCTTLWHFYLN